MATAKLLLFIILIIAFMFTGGAAAASPLLPPSDNTSLVAAILSSLGFQDLAAAAAAVNLSAAIPATIFAPTDSSLLTCPSCSVPLLLQEHSLPGLYPIHFLRTLDFGTKIESFAANRCLTITASTSAAATAPRKVFINGVEITKPDFFYNGLLIIHGLQGFVSHLSPLSCRSTTTVALPQQPPPMASFVIMRSMLKDAMTILRISGYSIVALAMRVKYLELSALRSMTLFAIDDESIFMDGGRGEGRGHAYVAQLRFHIVPNRLLTAGGLMGLPKGTTLQTMDSGRNLVVTSAGGEGPLAPMRINYVKVKRFDMVHNSRIVVHVVSTPFPDLDHLVI
ncbi:hypothetical protein Salat_2241000 [Sesamum alatum]|uniref:Fasciclin-like arabinogalactan protein 21 n=1 Tax=Sesamum alatum TaxID=300844 RepID=A0AAE1XUG2_9LAMI|nr:hypothetical protein Salat_2241000 [Sesamum alatum]